MTSGDNYQVRCPQCQSVDGRPKEAEKTLANFILGIFAFVLDLFSPSPRSIALEHYNTTKSGYICQKCGFIFRQEK